MAFDLQCELLTFAKIAISFLFKDKYYINIWTRHHYKENGHVEFFKNDLHLGVTF